MKSEIGFVNLLLNPGWPTCYAVASCTPYNSTWEESPSDTRSEWPRSSWPTWFGHQFWTRSFASLILYSARSGRRCGKSVSWMSPKGTLWVNETILLVAKQNNGWFYPKTDIKHVLLLKTVKTKWGSVQNGKAQVKISPPKRERPRERVK